MKKFEILCTTMKQVDFSKLKEMNINTNVVFANQTDHVSFEEQRYDKYTAKMISTNTQGVGNNRNIALMYANAEICLFADDDIRYVDNLEKIVTEEFDMNPDADVIIFNLDSNSNTRKQKIYNQTKKHHFWEPMPWGGPRIAFRLKSIRKHNLWFTSLFGGGCIFPAGEDSMWLMDAKRAKLNFYVSDKTIGVVSFDDSSWFTGRDEKYYYGRGAYYQHMHPYTFYLWCYYFAFRTKKNSKLKFFERIIWMIKGKEGYSKLMPYKENTYNK